jgi:hypothetical protein
MDELLYLLLGWLLGLLGPRVIDLIKGHYDRRALAIAIRNEAQGLSFVLFQSLPLPNDAPATSGGQGQ